VVQDEKAELMMETRKLKTETSSLEKQIGEPNIFKQYINCKFFH
jgi:hypothetical protein